MNHVTLVAPAAPATVWPTPGTLCQRFWQTKTIWLSLLLLLPALAIQAAPPLKQWNGSVSTNWATPANWTPAVVPVAGDSVLIPGAPANQPVIFSGTLAKAKNVKLQPSADLIINAGGELELASTFNVSGVINEGTVTNNGLLKVKSGFQGIENPGSFVNNGTIRLGEATSSPYAFTEEGIAMYVSGGSFVNNSTGDLVILRPGNNGVLLFTSGTTFTNYGKITVRNGGLNPATAETADGLDARGGAFVNETTGNIVISSITANGLNCRNAGSFTNKGNIKIGNVGLTTALQTREGINNTASITNTSTGQITIDTCSNSAIFNQGVINNSGVISIGASKPNSIGNIGLGNLAGFNNLAGATLHIRNAKSGILTGGLGGLLTNYPGATITIGQVIEDGIEQFGLGGTDNRGILNIGTTGNVGGYGINNSCQFLNQFGATLTIINTTNTAFLNTTNAGVDGLVKNGGKIAIDNSANAGAAILNTVNCTFENLNCVALIQIISDNIISNAGTFTNQASIIEYASGNSSVTTNSGIIQNLNGGMFTVTGSNTGTISTLTGAIWTGCENTNWTSALNWHHGEVPIGSENVLIPNRSNDPVILGGIAAEAKSVVVEENASLGVNALASLTISGSTGDGLSSEGTVTNAGLLKISITGGIGFYNGGTFNNNGSGELQINRTAGDGILQGNATLNNFAKIKIGNTGSIGGYGIQSVGSPLENKAGGEITVDRAANGGIFIYSHSMTNAGKITIGGIAGTSIGGSGIVNSGTVTNNIGGEILIDRTAQYGVSNGFGTFNNYALLKIGSVATIGYSGISNEHADMSNFATGEITIDRTTYSGIHNFYSGYTNNSGKISIGQAAAIGDYGVRNYAIFNNSNGSTLLVDRTGDDAILNDNDFDNTSIAASFNNGSATIKIGSTAAITGNGIHNKALFNNNSGGQILVNNTSLDGLLNVQGSLAGNFNNAGQLSIGSTVAPGGYGLNNQNTLVNNACGDIILFDNLNNSSTITNAGVFRMNTALAHTNSGTFTNNGVIEYPQGSLIPNVTNNDVIVKPVTGECTVANALQIGGANSFTIGTTWYKNLNLTGSAGTYNQAANTFTISGLTEGSTNTLYFLIYDIANSCVRTLSIQLTYDDVTKPMITCPANQTVAANNSCSGTIGSWTLASKSDNCAASGSITETQSPASSTVLTGHNTVQTVTLTANDGNGNTQTCQFSVTLKDVIKPVITCPANQIVAASSTCSGFVGSWSLASKSDNCTASGGISESQSPAGTTVMNGHNSAQTVTLTANDGNDNTQTCQFTVTLKDFIIPTITCPADQTVAADGACSAVVGNRTGLATNLTDNCTAPGNITVQQSPADNTLLSGHDDFEIVTLRSDDGNGNLSLPCTFKVILKDITPPAIVCPANIAKSTDPNQCSAVTNYTVTASDNCVYTTTQTNGLASGTAFPTGTNVVNWKVTDAAGLTAICSFTVTVTDSQLPSIVCPANVNKTTDPGQCSAVATYAAPTFSDNCATAGIQRISGPASGSVFPKGTTMVNWKAVDAAGNSSVCGFTVTVTDGQAPTITCPANIVKGTDAGQCNAVVTYVNPVYTDNCTGAGLDHITGGLSGSTFPKGVTSVVWQATDAANLTQRCTFTITVNDNQAPAITCPANQTKSTDPNFCTAIATYPTPTFTDNCAGGSVVIQSGLASGSAFPKGINTVAWRATDAAGLTKTCTFRITVNDTQAPAISCPPNQSKTTDTNLCTSVATYTDATFTDNCTGGSVVKLSGLNSGSAFPKGVNNVVFKATDASGNQSLCTMTVTVSDAQLPTITCPANIVATGSISNGVCSATVTYTHPAATDNCGILSNYLWSGLASGSVFPEGVTTNVWKATDESGWTATCAFTVSVGCGSIPKAFGIGKAAFTPIREERIFIGVNAARPIPNAFGILPTLALAPNPATTDVLISVNGLGENKAELKIFDAQGRVVWQSSTVNDQQSTADLSNFASGLYQVRLMTEHGVVTKALVVSKL